MTLLNATLLPHGGWLSAELMMFGPNPVPPKPLELLRWTREHTLRTWGG